MTFEAYSPLGNLGLDGSPNAVLNDPTVAAVARAHNRSTAQVALKWLVQQGIAVVTASGNATHIADDLRIFDAVFELRREEMAQLRAAQAALCLATPTSTSDPLPPTPTPTPYPHPYPYPLPLARRRCVWPVASERSWPRRSPG